MSNTTPPPAIIYPTPSTTTMAAPYGALSARERYQYLLSLSQYNDETFQQRRFQQQMLLRQYNNMASSVSSSPSNAFFSFGGPMMAGDDNPLQPHRNVADSVSGNENTAAAAVSLRRHRSRFCLFIKILFRQLEQSHDDFLLKQVKKLVQTAVSQKAYTSLEYRLRDCVGESHWRRAQSLTMYYLRRQRMADNNDNKKNKENAEQQAPRPAAAKVHNIAHSA